MSEWISVKDRLPKSITNKVIVFCESEEWNSYIGFGHYEDYKGVQTWFNLETQMPFSEWSYTVTHWMPLPEPPKEGDGE